MSHRNTKQISTDSKSKSRNPQRYLIIIKYSHIHQDMFIGQKVSPKKKNWETESHNKTIQES